MLEEVLNIPALRLHLTMFCVIITKVWWNFSNSYMARGWCAFLWIFQKNYIDNISWKSQKRQGLIGFILVNTIPTHPKEQHLLLKQMGTTTIFSFGHQSCVLPRSDPFFWQNPCSGCNSGTDLVVALEYLSFNFVPMPNKFLLGWQDSEEAM